MAKDIAATRVTKKLLPQQPGAKKLTAQFGEMLVCVRYRLDPAQGRRYTTVELVVDEALATSLPKALRPVYIRLAEREVILWQSILNAGAQWDKAQQAWRLTTVAAKRLKIQHRAMTECLPVDSKT